MYLKRGNEYIPAWICNGEHSRMHVDWFWFGYLYNSCPLLSQGNRTGWNSTTGGNDLLSIDPQPIHAIRENYELELINEAKRWNIPMIGVCKGAQLLAYHFGSSVEKIEGHVIPEHEVKSTTQISDMWSKIQKVIPTIILELKSVGATSRVSFRQMIQVARHFNMREPEYNRFVMASLNAIMNKVGDITILNRSTIPDSMRGLILAAGARFQAWSANCWQTKCMTLLGGKTLLQWTLECMHASGIRQIALVRGYLGNTLTENGLVFLKMKDGLKQIWFIHSFAHQSGWSLKQHCSVFWYCILHKRLTSLLLQKVISLSASTQNGWIYGKPVLRIRFLMLKHLYLMEKEFLKRSVKAYTFGSGARSIYGIDQNFFNGMETNFFLSEKFRSGKLINWIWLHCSTDW